MKRSLITAAFALLVSASVLPAIAQFAPKPKPQAKTKDALKDPSKLNEKAPATFKARIVTTEGEFVVDVTRAWSPNGADRFYNLVKFGYFDGVKFFRVIPGFMAQFGIHGDPTVSAKWRDAKISDDPVVQSNKPGFLSFATAGPNTRTTQLFINLADNARLDGMGFSPFGKVSKGMDVVNKIYSGYGENPRDFQGAFQEQGNKYAEQNFPKMDSIKTAVIVK